VPVNVLIATTVFCDVLLCGLSVFCSTGCHAFEECSLDTDCEKLKSYYFFWGRGGGGGEVEIVVSHRRVAQDSVCMGCDVMSLVCLKCFERS
jgi:hypothetical protein